MLFYSLITLIKKMLFTRDEKLLNIQWYVITYERLKL